jgi:hypothetical protein
MTFFYLKRSYKQSSYFLVWMWKQMNDLYFDCIQDLFTRKKALQLRFLLIPHFQPAILTARVTNTQHPWFWKVSSAKLIKW